VNHLSNPIITIIRDQKHVLGKKCKLLRDGTIDIVSEVKVSEGWAVMHHVPDMDALAQLLLEVSDDSYAAIINASFEGVEVGEPFLIYSEEAIKSLLGNPEATRQATKGVHLSELDGKSIKVIGRLKENVKPSSWQFVDRDVDEHTPKKFADLSTDEYITELDKLLPGFINVDKVLTGSTSARVRLDGEPASKVNGHIWFGVADHTDVDRLRATLIVRAAEQKLTWLKPRFSKATREVCGHSLVTILDTTVYTPGRLVFCGKPVAGKGLVVDQQRIERIDKPLKVIDTALLVLPDEKRVREITSAAGQELGLSNDSLSIEAYDLSLETELELKDCKVITLSEAIEMGESKIKCQTPFRESSSLAAFMSFDSSGYPFVYDVGTSTTHKLARLEQAKLDFAEPYEVLAEISHAGLDHLLVDYLQNDVLEFMPHVVDKWIPCNEVTLLAGHGGGGKSYVALSLAIHVALGLRFGRLDVTQSNVLFFSGEDGAQVLRMRLARLCQVLQVDRSALVGKLHILDASDIDPALHRGQKAFGTSIYTKTETETETLKKLAQLVKSVDAGLVIVDNASDAYDDDEIQRARVRAFMRSMRTTLGRPGRAVLLLVHVNKASASTGKRAGAEDYSGSTAWHNSARSRLSLAPSDGGFTIEHLKANLGSKADPVSFEWINGAPMITARSLEDSITLEKADKIAVLKLIFSFNNRKQLVGAASSGSATTYHALHSAPDFPKHLQSKNVTAICEGLLTVGYLRTVVLQTNSRHKKTCYEITLEGKKYLDEEDLSFLD